MKKIKLLTAFIGFSMMLNAQQIKSNFKTIYQEGTKENGKYLKLREIPTIGESTNDTYEVCIYLKDKGKLASSVLNGNSFVYYCENISVDLWEGKVIKNNSFTVNQYGNKKNDSTKFITLDHYYDMIYDYVENPTKYNLIED